MDTRGSAESREHNTIINHQSHESFAPLHSQMGLRLPHPPVFQVGIARGDNEETKALILRAHFQEVAHHVRIARRWVPRAPVARETREGTRLQPHVLHGAGRVLGERSLYRLHSWGIRTLVV